MSQVESFSPASSIGTASSDSSCLPRNRIRCSNKEIVVGEHNYQCASDALRAYLHQFSDISDSETKSCGSNGHNKSSVTTLLASSSKSSNDILGGLVHILPPGGRGPKLHNSAVASMGKTVADSDLVIGPDGIKVAGAKGDVEELLTSKVSPELQEEVTDALREVKLRRLLKQAALKSQNQTKTGLQQEVEAALTRSAQLLEKVTREDIPSTQAIINDTNSSINTSSHLEDSTLSLHCSLDGKDRKTHRLTSSSNQLRPSRFASHNHLSSSLTSCAPVSYRSPRQPRERMRHSSAESLLPSPHTMNSGHKRSSSSSSASLSNQSDPTDVLRRIRSRSMSPSLRHPPATVMPDWVDQLDRSVKKSVPSWIGEINASEVSDSLWTNDALLESKHNKRPEGRVPSWLGQVARSDISLGDSAALDTKLLVSPPVYEFREGEDVDNHRFVKEASNITVDSSRPGLNYSDLATSVQHTPGSNKHVTFSAVGETQDNGKQYPKHSTPLVNGGRSTSHNLSLSRPAPSKVMDSEFNGEAFLRNHILPQTAKLRKSLDNFVASSETQKCKSVSSNSSDTSSDLRASSLDTLALLTGKAMTRHDVTGASPIPKDSNVASKSFSTSPAISSVDPKGPDQDSSDGLDGDRSWEKVPSTFKLPVPVNDEILGIQQLTNGISQKKVDHTLSGGKQPGSMEALKNMLFKLQAEESLPLDGIHLTQDPPLQTQDPPLDTSHQNESPVNIDIIPALEGYNFKKEPGGHSLEKALLHLNRLKDLVKTTSSSSNDDARFPSATHIQTVDVSNQNTEFGNS